MTEIKSKVFRDGSKFIRPTGESVRQFEGIIIAVYEGESPETVLESVRSVSELRGLPEVDLATLSVPWRVALGLPTADVAQSKRAITSNDGATIGRQRRKGRASSNRNFRRPNGNVNVVETHYQIVSPKAGWLAINVCFMLAIINELTTDDVYMTVFMGAIGTLSFMYVWASTTLGGTVQQHKADDRFYI